jgi:hypothetical protein
VLREGARLTDVKVNPGGGDNHTCEHFADAGDDAYPIPTDYTVIVENPRTGGRVSVGYVDPINTPKATLAEKRIYGRTTAGLAINEVWLKSNGDIVINNDVATVTLFINGNIVAENDTATITAFNNGDIRMENDVVAANMYNTGEVDLTNGSGTLNLAPNGTFDINGVTIDASGNMIVPTSLILNGRELNLHQHPITSGSSAPGPTGPNI